MNVTLTSAITTETRYDSRNRVICDGWEIGTGAYDYSCRVMWDGVTVWSGQLPYPSHPGQINVVVGGARYKTGKFMDSVNTPDTNDGTDYYQVIRSAP